MLACIKFGFDLFYSTIKPDGDDLGCTRSTIPPPDDPKKPLDEYHLIELYAGYAAAAEFDPQNESDALLEARHDFGKARKQPIRGASDEPWISEAKGLIEKNWKAIERIAAGLLKYETLWDVDLYRLFRFSGSPEEALEELARERALDGR